MANKNDQLVLSYYPNAAAAQTAADRLKLWDDDNDEIKLGAIAVLTLKSNGDLDYHEVGQRTPIAGALWGTAVGAAVGLLAGGIGIIPGAIAGAAGGGLLGSFNHKNVGMSDPQRNELIANLKEGGAALAVMADDFELDPLRAELVRYGGSVTHYHVPKESAYMMARAAEAQAMAVELIDESVATSMGDVAGVRAEVAAPVEIETWPDLDENARRSAGRLAAVTGMSAGEACRCYDAGVDRPSTLMARAATPQGRADLAGATGLDSSEILRQAKKLDLMRIKGVGVKYAELLLVSGVDTVPELATRNPANLTKRMAEVNAAMAVCETLPVEEEVSAWINQAKELPRLIYY
ncbi:MAG: DUF4332 domain-containing protein [Candidatus Promineifilaceae bacterium]